MKKIKIDGNNCTTRAELFETFSKELNFPNYFANNWDSFEEIMGDLSWIPEEELLLEISHYQRILCNEDDEQKDIFFNVLSTVEQYSGKSFLIEFIGE